MDFLITWGRESLLMVGLVIVPAAAAWAALVAARSRDAGLGRAVVMATIDIGLVVSLLAIAILGLRPGPGIPGGWEQWNVVPFRDLARAIDGRPWGLRPAVTGVVGNLLLFVPFGLFFGLRFRTFPWWRFVALAGGLAIGVELAQALMGTGRASDVTDVITNLAGASLGFAAARFLVGRVGHRPSRASSTGRQGESETL